MYSIYFDEASVIQTKSAEDNLKTCESLAKISDQMWEREDKAKQGREKKICNWINKSDVYVPISTIQIAFESGTQMISCIMGSNGIICSAFLEVKGTDELHGTLSWIVTVVRCHPIDTDICTDPVYRFTGFMLLELISNTDKWVSRNNKTSKYA